MSISSWQHRVPAGPRCPTGILVLRLTWAGTSWFHLSAQESCMSERGVWVTLMDSFLCAIGLWMLEVVPRVESTILSLGRVRLLALLVPMAKFWVSETQQSHKLINKLINFKINKIDNQQEPTVKKKKKEFLKKKKIQSCPQVHGHKMAQVGKPSRGPPATLGQFPRGLCN